MIRPAEPPAERPSQQPSPELSEVLGSAILAGLDPDGQPRDHLAIVARTALAEDEVARLMRRSVLAARAAGHSWATLGHELGMSRQAVQQRFGDRRGAVPAAHPGAGEAGGQESGDQERWLGPVTAFDEMAELEIAGRQGWRTVDAGMLKHRVRRTPTQWEHKRVVWTGPVRRWEIDGWQVAIRAFPWVYLVRDTGRPAQDPPSS